uniref:Uncharacterized protein n=1 Tax=Arundo donax TaxID=35708 RepID=A0A0A9D4H5_ARUDO
MENTDNVFIHCLLNKASQLPCLPNPTLKYLLVVIPRLHLSQEAVNHAKFAFYPPHSTLQFCSCRD